VARGGHAEPEVPRVLDSPQTVMICRTMVITFLRSAGPSQQCRQDLIVPPLLKPGLLSFLNQSSRRVATCRHRRTSPQELPRLHRGVVRVLWKTLVRPRARTGWNLGLRSRPVESTCRPRSQLLEDMAYGHCRARRVSSPLTRRNQWARPTEPRPSPREGALCGDGA
jgi:hypothetical protein